MDRYYHDIYLLHSFQRHLGDRFPSLRIRNTTCPYQGGSCQFVVDSELGMSSSSPSLEILIDSADCKLDRRIHHTNISRALIVWRIFSLRRLHSSRCCCKHLLFARDAWQIAGGHRRIIWHSRSWEQYASFVVVDGVRRCCGCGWC